jgi:hypothetical protein
LNQWIDRELIEQIALSQTKEKKDDVIGGRLDPPVREEIATSFKKEVGARREQVLQSLFQSANGKCAKCHAIPPGAREVTSPAIPTVWFEKAWFNHVSHRALECQACHPMDNVPGGKDEPIRIANIGTCRQCHGPIEAGAAGVTHRCVDCHRYHNGQHPLQGLAAPARDPERKLSIDEWLSRGKGKNQ